MEPSSAKLLDSYIEALEACLATAEGFSSRNNICTHLSSADEMRDALNRGDPGTAWSILTSVQRELGWLGIYEPAGASAHEALRRFADQLKAERFDGLPDAGFDRVVDSSPLRADFLEFARRLLAGILVLFVTSALVWVGFSTPDLRGLSNSILLVGVLSVAMGVLFGFMSKQSFLDAADRHTFTGTSMSFEESNRLAVADERTSESESRMVIWVGVAVATLGAVVGYFA